jgi:post-segregation antitoxin (ccd killing protein)
MSKVQSRRTISLNREVYKAARREAKRRGLSASHFVELCLRNEIAGRLPKTKHVTWKEANRAARASAAVRYKDPVDKILGKFVR